MRHSEVYNDLIQYSKVWYGSTQLIHSYLPGINCIWDLRIYFSFRNGSGNCDLTMNASWLFTADEVVRRAWRAHAKNPDTCYWEAFPPLAPSGFETIGTFTCRSFLVSPPSLKTTLQYEVHTFPLASFLLPSCRFAYTRHANLWV